MTWALQDAKAKLSELVRRALSEGPQFVTVRGKPSLVVMSQAMFRSLTRRRRTPLVDLYRDSPIAGETIDLKRAHDRGRRVDL